ncbi:hypothetical protein [Dyadobacter bucti]|uniref:hypothetical protein n=1 Tax=Dyadobacter bucti TaxID=2572203 RepID=UPI0011082011|nr:hypothetical protein [Dyadobacter bucti]
MTLQELKKVPERGPFEDIGDFDSLIILPTKELHDSGYRAMEFIAVNNGVPLCRLSGYSDALHIEGMLGSGMLGPGLLPKQIKDTSQWTIDCLAKSGLLRLFCRHQKLVAGDDQSSSKFTLPQLVGN